MALMISLYCTTQLGGGIPAILFNMPGEGGAAATVLDGYPMTKKGQAQQALVCCFAASAFGGLITTIITMAMLPALAKLGLYFRSVEMVVGDGVRPHADRRDRRAGSAQGPDRRLLRPDDRRDRRRSGVRHAARDLRLPRALRRRAADPGADRPVRDLRSVRDAGKRNDRPQARTSRPPSRRAGPTRWRVSGSTGATGGRRSGPR